MKPLRVCIDARIKSGNVGGVEQVVIGLASGLSRLSDGDEEYLFLTYSDSTDWLTPYLGGACSLLEGSPAPRPAGWKQWLRSKPAISNLIHRFYPAGLGIEPGVPTSGGTAESAGADVMHFPTQSGFITEIPSIYHPHDLQHLHLPEFFTKRQILTRETWYRTLCQQADIVAVASSWVKSDLIEQYKLPESKISVVPLAPVLGEYKRPTDAEREAAKRKYHLPDSFIFYPAATWPHKNHINLLEALAEIRDRYGVKVPFVSTGKKTEFLPTIEAKAHELGLDDQVHFLGFVSPLELQCIYTLSRCVAISTTFEAASFPVWEAFLAGVPVCCSRVTSLPRQVGDAAVLFDPADPVEIADSIMRIWTDDRLSRCLVEAAQRRVAAFTWEKTARQFRAHYRRIAGRALTDEDQSFLSDSPSL